jgi:hypothetical protein
LLFLVGADSLLRGAHPWAEAILGWVDVDNDLKLMALERKAHMVLGF